MSNTATVHNTSRSDNKKRSYVDSEVIKGLHNLISWKLFNSNSRDLTVETLPNRRAARKIDKEIDAYKALHGLD